MKTTIKAARLQSKEGKLPYSGMACLLMFLFAGFLVKFAAFTPIFHSTH